MQGITYENYDNNEWRHMPTYNNTIIPWIVQGENSDIKSSFFFNTPPRWVGRVQRALGKFAVKKYKKPFVVHDSYMACEMPLHNFIMGDDRFTVSEEDRGTLKRCMSTMVNTLYQYNSDKAIVEMCFPNIQKARFGGKMFTRYPLYMDMTLYEATTINEKYPNFGLSKYINPNNEGRVFILAMDSNCCAVNSSEWYSCSVNNILVFDGEAFLNEGVISVISDEFFSCNNSSEIRPEGKAVYITARKKALIILRKILKNLIKEYPGLPIEQLQILPNTNSNVCGFNLIPTTKDKQVPFVCKGGPNDYAFSMYYEGYDASRDYNWIKDKENGVVNLDGDDGAEETTSELLNFVVCLEA